MTGASKNGGAAGAFRGWRWLWTVEMPGAGALHATVPPAAWPVMALWRMFLALVVLSHHLTIFAAVGSTVEFLHQLNGSAAVILFLFISGYSISHSVTKEPNGFYRRRAWRILPVYWASLALTVVIYVIAPAHTAAAGGAFPLYPATTTAWLWHILPLNGVTNPVLWGNFVIWSLGVEVALYALAPLLMRMRSAAVIALLIVSAGLYVRWENGGPMRFGAWPLGTVLYYAWAWLAGMEFYRNRAKVWACVLPFVSLGVLAQIPVDAAPGPLGMCLVFGLLVVALPYIPKLPRAAARLAFIVGDLSYPLYLVHIPTYWALWICFESNQQYVYLISAGCLTVAVYVLVDLPTRRLHQALAASVGPHDSTSLFSWETIPRSARVLWPSRHRAFALAAAASTLLFLMTITLWVLSPRHHRQQDWLTRSSRWSLDRDRSGLTLHVRHLPISDAPRTTPLIRLARVEMPVARMRGRSRHRLQLPGLRLERGIQSGMMVTPAGKIPVSHDRYRQVSLSWWLAAVATGLLPMLWLRRWIAAGRKRRLTAATLQIERESPRPVEA